MGGKHGDVTMEMTSGRGKTKWLKRYATLNPERKMLLLCDKKIPDDVITPGDNNVRSIELNADLKCIPSKSERKKFKGGKYLLKIMSSSEGGECGDSNTEVTLSMKTEVDRDEWVKEINGVINKQEDAPTPEVITMDLDVIKVETNALNHLNKTRPKFQGRRRPHKRPRRMLEDIDENAEKKQKTDKVLDSPLRSAGTDGTDAASSSGLGLDSEADVTSKGPSTSCSRENLDENAQGRKYKRKGKTKHGASPSPVHGEVRRRHRVDRSTSLLKRLSNRLSQVFGHGSGADPENPDNTRRGSSDDRGASQDSLPIAADGALSGSDVDGTLALITTNAEKLLDLAKSLREDMKSGARTGDAVQTNLKHIRLAMKHLEKSLNNLTLVEKAGSEVEE